MARLANILSKFVSASDEQLMWRVKLEGDEDAFVDLMNRWETPIQDLCTRMTGDIDRAQDMAQTAFTRVYARRSDWQPKAKFSTFLWRIALNLCHDELRSRSRRGECSLEKFLEEDEHEPPFLAVEEPGPDAMAEVNERGEIVRQALMKLAPHYREVVALRHYEQLKFCEIADVLNIPEGTAKSRMSEALTQLEKLLQPLNENISCNPKIQRKEILAL